MKHAIFQAQVKHIQDCQQIAWSLKTEDAFLVIEPPKPNHDHQFVGGAVLVRLQNALGSGGIRRSGHAPRALRPHLEAGHRVVQ